MQWEIKALWGNSARLAGSVELNVLMYFGDERKRDIDAYLKIVLDALSGIVYEDDSQIEAMHVYKSVEKSNPRIEIQVL
jgi:crossover junction endodeoxyribonuclease RusA